MFAKCRLQRACRRLRSKEDPGSLCQLNVDLTGSGRCRVRVQQQSFAGFNDKMPELERGPIERILRNASVNV